MGKSESHANGNHTRTLYDRLWALGILQLFIKVMAQTWMIVRLGKLEGASEFSGQPDYANLAHLGKPVGPGRAEQC